MDPSPLRALSALVSLQLAPNAIPADAWGAITALALQHGLGPMLLWSVRQQAPELVTEPLWSPVLAEARAAAAHHIRFKAVQEQVNAALTAAGIPALWLKGIVLAETVYPQPALRPMSDLDVLVPYDARQAAVDALERAGGVSLDRLAVFDRDRDAVITEKMIRYNNKFAFGGEPAIMVELHYRLLSTDNIMLPVERLALFWEQTQRVGEMLTLRPAAHLLYLCAHAVLQHKPDDMSLLRYFDLHRLITQTPPDWDWLVEHAAALRWTFGVEQALQACIDPFATPVPAEVMAALHANRSLQDILPYRRPEGPGSRWLNTLAQMRRLTAREKALVVRKIMFPSAAYMRARYHIPRSRPTWPYYAYRWFDQGRDVAWALWKRLTGRYRAT